MTFLYSLACREFHTELLRAYAAKARLDIWAYCLMSNHARLLVVPRREDSQARAVGLFRQRILRLKKAGRKPKAPTATTPKEDRFERKRN